MNDQVKEKVELTRLGRVIEERGIRTGWLAAKAKTTSQSIRNYKVGASKPDAETLYLIAQALGVQMEDLVEAKK